MDANIIDSEKFEIQSQWVPAIVRARLEAFVDFERSSTIDFGCDLGIKAYGYAQNLKFKRVIGVDISTNFQNLPGVLERHAGDASLPPNLEFRLIRPGQSLAMLAPVDGFISWSVFEHIQRAILEQVTRDLFLTLRPGGIGYVQVNPLYYSRFGSHLGHIFKHPWQHLLDGEEGFERRIFAAVDLTERQKTGAWSLFQSLNQVRVSDFERCFAECGFEQVRLILARSQERPPEALVERYGLADLEADGFYAVLRRPLE